MAELIASARSRGLRIEGHSPGASARTLGVAAAAGVTADHESQRGDELRERLRSGLWAYIRYTDLLRDAPAILREVLERGLSLERTAFTTDHLGVLAPARLASLNVLTDLENPFPERVFSMGREVARDGELLIEGPDVDWAGLGAPRWSERRTGPHPETFIPSPEDPVISLESSVIVRSGSGFHTGEPLICVALHPDTEMFTRAAIHGLPERLEGIASTLTPRRLLVAAGCDHSAISRCVDVVIEAGGGIAYQHQGAMHLLALPVGGAITAAPFSEVLAFWEQTGRLFAELGRPLADPLSTLLYIGSDSLPGARFNARGLVDTRSGDVIEPARPLRWR